MGQVLLACSQGEALLLSNQSLALAQLYDLEAWESRPDTPTNAEDITGTPLFVGKTVLPSHPHTVSTQLEGLFISLLAISCKEKLFGRHLVGIMPLSVWTCVRSGAMRRTHLHEDADIEIGLRPFIRSLHNVFYTLAPDGNQRLHNACIEPNAFRQVCLQSLSQRPVRPSPQFQRLQCNWADQTHLYGAQPL